MSFTTTPLYPDGSTLVSGVTLKTVNNESLLGFGNLTIAGGSGLSTVSVTGAGTTILAANTRYYFTSAAAYTRTLDTSALAAGDVVRLTLAWSVAHIITIACAAGIRGKTTQEMRNGEGMDLRWNGTTFDIEADNWIPFYGAMAPSGNKSLSGETKVDHNTIIGPNQGYGLLNTSNGRFTAPRDGDYIVQPMGRSTALGGNATRFITFCRKNGVSGQYFCQHEISAGAGSYPYAGAPSPITLAAGDYLEHYMLVIGTGATIAGSGDSQNSWWSLTEIRQP